MRIGFIGAGVVGTALAVRLHERRYDIVAAASRRLSSAENLAGNVPGCRSFENKQAVADASDLVFVTTPDDAIVQVADELNWRAGQFVVHCSGADSLGPLEKARQDGATTGGFHPLQTFASVTHAIDNLPGSTFAIEAEGELLGTLKAMAEALEGRWVVLGPGDKVLYHAAAVIACNYMVTLTRMAADLWETFGATPPEAIQALHPLLQGTVNNIVNVGLPDCLTGPIARGDLGTISKHLDALEERAPSIAPLYRQLGLQTIPIALDKGKIDEERARELGEIFGKS